LPTLNNQFTLVSYGLRTTTTDGVVLIVIVMESILKMPMYFEIILQKAVRKFDNTLGKLLGTILNF
jgi:hypothetical protein